MLVVVLKEVMASFYQLHLIQMVVKHQGRGEHDFKEQSWRLRVKKVACQMRQQPGKRMPICKPEDAG
jgi:hypothetical protein